MKIQLVFGLLIVVVSHVSGLDLMVNSELDATDNSLGDGLCADASGNCTLRAAIQEINTFGDPSNTITLPSGTYILTIAGINENGAATGDLDCLQSVDILGGNARTTIINANGLDRVFHLQSGTINISKLTIINGSTDIGGGVYNLTTSTMSEITISNGVANRGLGGGIYNSGILSISKSTFSNNTAAGEQGGNGGFGSGGGGGGSITGSGGNGGFGGGAAGGGANSWGGNAGSSGSAGMFGGTCGVMCCSASGGGGGGAGLGGGIFNNGGTVTIENTTITLNEVGGGNGGGGYWYSVTSPGQGVGGGMFNYSGGVSIKNTIVAGNSSTTSDSDLYGNFNSDNYNLIQMVGSATISGVTAQNIIGQSPNLQALGDNGGETDTHGFTCASPAYNNGQTSLGLDQTCNTRPQGIQEDIGALELMLMPAFKR